MGAPTTKGDDSIGLPTVRVAPGLRARLEVEPGLRALLPASPGSWSVRPSCHHGRYLLGLTPPLAGHAAPGPHQANGWWDKGRPCSIA